jgi:hypothetical protein
MVAITPNTYLYNKSAINLRKYLIKNKLIQEIIDFKSTKVFPNISTYCCITIFTLKQKDFLTYNNNIINYNSILEPTYNLFSQEHNNNIPNNNIPNNNIINNNKIKLNDICNIKNGIATLRDKIFIHKIKKYEEPCWKVITNAYEDMWIIYPYNEKGKILEEEEFKNNNPLTYLFLEENKVELSKRDKGHKTYPKWYAYGRTQSIQKPQSSYVLYIPTFIDPLNITYKIDQSKLCVSCLSIEINNNNNKFTLQNVIEVIKKNIDYIKNNSSKRGGGWISLSGTILKTLEI